jgi:hypothetical protein
MILSTFIIEIAGKVTDPELCDRVPDSQRLEGDAFVQEYSSQSRIF